PKGVMVDVATKTGTYAKMTAEPFEAGFGHTIGNALRRVMLSSLEGAAITTVNIDGISHEFTTIDGVFEDVTHVVLNLKKVLLHVTSRKPFECQLKAKGPCDVTASMISLPSGVEILNPDHKICTLTEKKNLQMELSIEIGRGYRPSELNKGAQLPIGTIPIDSLFSPVSKVKYAVEAARVGMKTDYDRLVLEVWTDGRVDPVAATVQSAQLLLDHVQLYRNAGEPMYLQAAPELPPEPPAETTAEDEKIAASDSARLEELGFSKRIANTLVKAKLTALAQITQLAEREVLELRNFGDKAVEEVKDVLKKHGLELKREPASESDMAELMKKSIKRKK
ncbi:MAG: DNA-directed RNA polymerase subunit alpha, partial [bacterium]|nr:DNA-directed RNA polymerase subunit alpha [bacterium]